MSETDLGPYNRNDASGAVLDLALALRTHSRRRELLDEELRTGWAGPNADLHARRTADHRDRARYLAAQLEDLAATMTIGGT